MLLDGYLPEFDVRTSHSIRIAAPVARVYVSLWNADFDYWGLTRAFYAVRTLPSLPTRTRETWRRFRDELLRQRFSLDGMLSEGFTLLEERPGEELVLGTVGRFWRARGELWTIGLARFRAPAPPGSAKGAWSFEVAGRADGATELRTENRILWADVATRRRFGA